MPSVVGKLSYPKDSGRKVLESIRSLSIRTQIIHPAVSTMEVSPFHSRPLHNKPSISDQSYNPRETLWFPLKPGKRHKTSKSSFRSPKLLTETFFHWCGTQVTPFYSSSQLAKQTELLKHGVLLWQSQTICGFLNSSWHFPTLFQAQTPASVPCLKGDTHTPCSYLLSKAVEILSVPLLHQALTFTWLHMTTP